MFRSRDRFIRLCRTRCSLDSLVFCEPSGRSSLFFNVKVSSDPEDGVRSGLSSTFQTLFEISPVRLERASEVLRALKFDSLPLASRCRRVVHFLKDAIGETRTSLGSAVSSTRYLNEVGSTEGEFGFKVRLVSGSPEPIFYFSR